MAEQLPIVLCGKTTVIGEKVIELLKPEHEVVYFILTSAAGQTDIPVCSGPPVAVVLGGGYDDEGTELMRASCDVDVPWFRLDTNLPAPPLGPEYVKVVIARLKVVMSDMKAEGKLCRNTKGVFWY
ncbi:hypothetical protein B0O99DRAFT_738272 [Bisporella sp. PMI_857]|nr:hypothetical protein B0O99DRAFT_738272 [Bisporella sp. PMI_857]